MAGEQSNWVGMKGAVRSRFEAFFVSDAHGAVDLADTLNAQGQSVPMELGTRVNKVQPKPANPQVQSVQFFPNPKLKKPE